MTYYVVKTNNSTNSFYVKELKYEELYAFLCIVDQCLKDDKIELAFDNFNDAEEYAETHWL